jgi:anti-sigma factor RsiW
MHRIDSRIDDEQLELLNAYLDGELPEEQRMALAEHVHACRVCAQELEELRAVRSALEGLPLVRAPRSFALEFEPAPAGPLDQLLSFLRDWLTPIWGISATVASVLFIVALVQTLTMSPAAARRATGVTALAPAAPAPPAAERGAPAATDAERRLLPGQLGSTGSAPDAAPAGREQQAEPLRAMPQGQPEPARQATPAQAASPGSPSRSRTTPVTTMPVAFYGAVVFTAIAVGGYLLQKAVRR